MRKEVAKKWVEDLRSGDFPQTTAGYLCTMEYAKDSPDDSLIAHYCCLGVLCTQFPQAGIPDGDRQQFPPSEILDLAGVEELDRTHFLEADSEEDFAFLNDTTGLDFNAIADIVERRYGPF